MSHDERIRQLSDLFLDDLRGPIEASVSQLLAQLMSIAADDRAAAVQEAVDRAAAEHGAAMQAARDDHARELEALRAEHQSALQEARADRAFAGAAESPAATDTTRQTDPDHQQALDALRAELVEQQRQAVSAALDQAAADREAALAALRADLDREHAEAMYVLHDEEAAAREAAVQAARDEIGATQAASLSSQHDELTAAHTAALATLRDDLVRDHEAVLAALEERSQGAWHTVAAERASLEEAIAALSRERDAARASVAELTDSLAAARARHEHLSELAGSESAAAEEIETNAVLARVEERQAELACSERLLAGFRDLDAAGSLTEVMSALARHAASEAHRVVILLAQNERLRGWRQHGMADLQADSIDLPVEQAGILAVALATGAPVSTSDAVAAAVDALPSFLAVPPDRVGLALPLVVGGRGVAVLYADAAGEEQAIVPSNWPEAIELLVRHAGRCLEVLTLSHAGAGPRRPSQESLASQPPASAPGLASLPDSREQEEESARRHARLLISEVKLYNEALVEQGRRDGNLLGLLGPEIERARRLYEEKIPAAVRQRVECFDEEIVRTLAGGDRALLGQTT